MTQTPHDVADGQHTPTSSALVPELIDAPDLPTFHNLALVSQLTANRRSILVALAINLISEDKHTEREIAQEIGISRQSIREARLDPVFAQALSSIMVDVIKGNSDIVVQNLFNLAENNVKANEILARIAEIYQPVQRNVNVNANISATQRNSQSFDDIWDDMLIRAGELGWSEDRIQELADTMVSRYRQLRTEGAF